MPPFNSVIRRYARPNCTLEIWAQSSPLSHLMGKTVIKQLTFELYFEDAQGLEAGKIVIRGDRDQLEILCDVVTNYVQKFLQQPPNNFWLSLCEPQDSSKVSHDSEFTDFDQTPLPSAQTSKSFISQTSQSKIYLEADNDVTHNLFLGSLSNSTSGSVIILSLLQLFDLATALDEYSADVMALPNLNNNNKLLRLPAWSPIAAVMVLGVGLLPLTWNFVNNRQNQTQIAKTAVKPSVDVPTQQPEVTPPGNLTSPQTLASNSQIPTGTFPELPLKPSNSSILTNPSSSLPSGQDPVFLSQPFAQRSLSSGYTLPSISSVPLSVSTNPQPNQSSLPSSPVNLQQRENTINGSRNIPTQSNNNNSLVGRSTSQPVTRTSETLAAGSQLFDIPQVAEAREIFTKRWQPPSGFTQTLEYSLMVNDNGSIDKIYPINQAARIFIEDVGMPEIGKPFVSANKNGEIIRIRVLLSPDGKVQTFAENE
ncbi:DUF4335 domain-containing protein [Anabaenopsis sp. FSS-46]|uniref:DUF4335 domain-containing protein n=1 Tax=Anabaenopsis sp. FSS-46 TaxID=2971766 RepID=UPI0024733E2E|nr:DUF4335 domain-containing protein [Anabaenopsis sp. FSS-46]MDH6099900.1 DUF4335 domain-containing protein [Anabaenopsis sp. FSS-46]